MSSLRIPKNRRDAFLLFSKISDAAVNELFAALMNVAPAKFGPELPKSLASSLKEVSEADGESILDTLLSLYPVIVSSGKSVNEVVDDLILALKRDSPRDDVVDDGQIATLRSNLQNLLKIPSIALGAKATSVRYDNERRLIGSRILSDIRPVFQLDSADIGGAVIIHTLKLEYADSSDGSKELYVALDSADIDKLIFNLQRAKEKEIKLKAMLALSSVLLLDSDDI